MKRKRFFEDPSFEHGFIAGLLIATVLFILITLMLLK